MSAARYQVDWVAEFLHQFPHVNFSFQQTNSTFDPDRTSYKEAIVFLAALPVVWCVVVLIITCCCLCAQCVKQKPKKKTKTTGLRLITAIFIILSIGALAVCFFGNEEGNKGVQSTVDAIQDTNDTVESTLTTLTTLDTLVTVMTSTSLTHLEQMFGLYVGNVTVKNSVLKKAKEIEVDSKTMLSDIDYVKAQLEPIDFNYYGNQAQNVEFYRWIGTVVLSGWQVIVLLIYIVGTLKKTKCWLVWAITLGYVSLFLIWVVMGVYLGGTVGLSDFCVDPDTFVKSVITDREAREVVSVYIDCENNESPANFSGKLTEAQAAVQKANTTLTLAIKETLPYNISRYIAVPVKEIRRDLGYTLNNISALSDVRYCGRIHSNYVKALGGFCNRALVGFSLILLVLPVMGLCLVFIQCLAPRIWLLLGQRKDYALVDNTDPFLPRGPPAYNDYQSMSQVDRNSLHEGGFLEEPSVMTDAPRPLSTASDSPPPAYYPGSFVEQYNNLASVPPARGNLQTSHY